MVKKFKPQTLRERIEKQSGAELDRDWTPHLSEALKVLGNIEPMPVFNLLDPESAKQAAAMCADKLENLNQVKKQVSTVNALLKQKKNEAALSIDELPWPKERNEFKK